MRPLGHDEAVPAGLVVQPADDEVHLVGQAEALPRIWSSSPAATSAFELALEGRAFVARHVEQLRAARAQCGGMSARGVTHRRENVVVGQLAYQATRNYLEVADVGVGRPSVNRDRRARRRTRRRRCRAR